MFLKRRMLFNKEKWKILDMCRNNQWHKMKIGKESQSSRKKKKIILARYIDRK